MTSVWPWQADTTQLDFARRLLQGYRTALFEAAPETCRQLDDFATTHGHHWVKPMLVTVGDDDLVDAAEAAAIAGVAQQTIYQWAYRKHIQRHYMEGHPTRYRVGDVLAHLDETRKKRTGGSTGHRSV